MEELLTMLKKSIGVLDSDTSLDDYYTQQLLVATADLSTDNISEAVLNSDLGKFTVVAYAISLINNIDIVSNSTLTLLRNKLSYMTDGEYYANRT